MSKKKTKWSRECPECGNILYYSSKQTLKYANNKESLCTSCSKLGKRNPFYGKSHNEKTIESMKEKLSIKMSGERNPFYGKTHNEKTKLLLSKLKSGKNHPNYGGTRSKETKRKIRLSHIKYRNLCDNNGVNYNKKACKFFKKLNEKFNLSGIHAESGGEYFVEYLGYWLDYYEPNLNLVIEWNEKHHYNYGELKEKDKLRNKEIEEYLNCDLFIIKQKDYFNKNKNYIKIIEENYII